MVDRPLRIVRPGFWPRLLQVPQLLGGRIDDPATAAEHFAFLVVGAPLDRALFHDDVPPADALDRTARAGLAAFRRAYAAG